MDNKILRLPPGFRFHPTDEELVVQYLRRKVFSCPLPASIISDISLGKHNPWDLLGGCEQERYFFKLREAKYANGQRSNRATGSGYWKATGKDKAVVSSRCNRAVGAKKVLVFYQGKSPGGERTDWIMHEYSLLDSPNNHHRGAGVASAATTRDWVLCRVFKKKKKRANKMEVEEEEEEEETGLNRFCFIDDFKNRPSSPSGSASSCVTEATDVQDDGEDISSLP